MCKEDDCVICFESLSISEGNFLKLKCKHQFHFNCIFQLMATNTHYNNQCPMCRGPLIFNNDLKNLEISTYYTDELINMSRMIGNLENQNDNLVKLLIILFGIILILLFIIFDVHVIINMIGYIFGFIYKILYFFFITLIFNSISWVWEKIGIYVTSILFLGFFTMMTNGYIPLFIN